MVLFRGLLVLVLGLGLMAPIARAEIQLDTGDGSAIRAVIERQIEAFRQDDSDSAFAFAAPSIRAMFGDAQSFMDMVRKSYQPVYRPSDIEFGELSIKGEIIAQQVHVIGQDGKPRTALYVMERQKDGSWAIAGCMLVDEPGRST